MKKGFTLIELLAVIVVLAIIALIATPMILGVIDSAKSGAAESSAYGYIEAIEKTGLKEMIDRGNYETKKDGIYDLNTIGTVKYKGKSPSKICITVKAGSVVSGSFQFDNLFVDYENGKAKINKTKTEITCDNSNGEVPEQPKVYDNGAIVYLNPETGLKCESGDSTSATGVKTGCMKWYAFNDKEGATTVDMILDHNTSAKSYWTSSYCCTDEGMDELEKTLKADTGTWKTELKTRVIRASELAQIVGNTSFNETSGPQFSINDTYKWLYDFTKEHSSNPEDSNLFGYWTSSPVGSSYSKVWIMNWDGNLRDTDIEEDDGKETNLYGVRPVITVDKSILK